MRSGECTNYDELMERVLKEAVGGVVGAGAGEGDEDAEGEEVGTEGAKAEGAGSLKIPQSVKDVGVAIVEKEIAKVVDFGDDDDAA